MDSQRVCKVELLTLRSPLPLRGVCNALQARFQLKDFAFTSATEEEWALTEGEKVSFCVSRPTHPITWPAGAAELGADGNVCVALLIEDGADAAEREAALAALTPQVAQGLADALGGAVVHQLTWRPDRPMVLHERSFTPGESNA